MKKEEVKLPHHATLHKSERLKRIYNLLKDGREYTSREIIKQANIVTLSASIDELRKNGLVIICRYDRTTPSGAKVYKYRMWI